MAIWSENRPEWIAALWGALLEGVVVVPIDYRTSAEFLLKVAGIVDAKAILVGDTVDVAPLGNARPVWKLGEIFRNCREPSRDRPSALPSSALDGGTTAEIIFTSGATAEPKGVVLTHKNILANIVPIEREMAKYRKYTIPFRPIRFLNLLPLSHMFGQAMATFVPPMLPGVVVFTRSYSPDDIIRQIKSAADLGARLGAEDPRRAAGSTSCASRPRRPSRRRPACTGRGAGGGTGASTGCSA